MGTQIDLREDSSTVEKLHRSRQKPTSYEQGEKLARELRAVGYVECSALTQLRRTSPYFSSYYRLSRDCFFSERFEKCLRRSDSGCIETTNETEEKQL